MARRTSSFSCQILNMKIQCFSMRFFKKNWNHLPDYAHLWINLFITFKGRFAGIKCLIYSHSMSEKYWLKILYVLGESAPHFTNQMVAKCGLTPHSVIMSSLVILLLGWFFPHTSSINTFILTHLWLSCQNKFSVRILLEPDAPWC